MHSSSLFFTLSGSWHGVLFACTCVCGPALVCMPVWLTHSAVNSVILGGPAVRGLHWHPTLGFKTQTNTGTLTHTLQNTHRGILKDTCINTHSHKHTAAWLCYGSAFQFSAQLHSTVTYSKPRSLFSLRTHTHAHMHFFNDTASH